MTVLNDEINIVNPEFNPAESINPSINDRLAERLNAISAKIIAQIPLNQAFANTESLGVLLMELPQTKEDFLAELTKVRDVLESNHPGESSRIFHAIILREQTLRAIENLADQAMKERLDLFFNFLKSSEA